MHEAQFSDIATWLTQAGLAGEPETAILTGFCERCVEADVPLARALVLIDTLHPIYEGRLVRWGHDAGESPLHDYGRTSPVNTLGGVRATRPPGRSRRKPANGRGAIRSITCCRPARRCCAAG